MGSGPDLEQVLGGLAKIPPILDPLMTLRAKYNCPEDLAW